MEEKKFDVLKLFQLIFTIPLLLISVYSGVSGNYKFLPFIFILMSAMFIIIGLREYKRTQNLKRCIFYLCTSLFIIFVAIQDIMIN